ncbi:hypothetical protein CHA01nite_05580 [Chryseobacterium hagamense]|uniref:HupE / UreJ protein n=2 Tax=Chryseobacterium hagamense TaxID=395935 RepID=A0A511YHY7_9FLAO|nr:hypothetical protein CHA01nite_05580 [Chryseobacterium hagamense]
MPNSVLLLDVYPENIKLQVQIPLKEMEFAVPFDVSDTSQLTSGNKALTNYLSQHIGITGKRQLPWAMHLDRILVKNTTQNGTGEFFELIAEYTAVPADHNTRQFTLYYDAVIHQVNSHRALVSIRQDWENGIIDNQGTEIGTVGYNLDTQKATPLNVDLRKGSNWRGFISMVKLGTQHISEGTDHLMFLLVLLLCAPLTYFNGKWILSSDLKSSLLKILKITISFTIGHSLTLILASLEIINFPVKTIEIIIALSILVTAVHVIKPVFPNRENIIALVFGLIHGLAFSTVLSELHLSAYRLLISLLGFNIGIEAMQFLIIILLIPWLLIISRYKIYGVLKNGLAVLAGFSALAWTKERFSGQENFISRYLNAFTENSILFVLFLFLLTMVVFLGSQIKGRGKSLR